MTFTDSGKYLLEASCSYCGGDTLPERKASGGEGCLPSITHFIKMQRLEWKYGLAWCFIG